jgi:mRNA interferase MazF
VVQSDDFEPLSTCVIAPTSTSARAATFRPEVEVLGVTTRVLVEQIRTVDRHRLGQPVGRLSFSEMRSVDAAVRLVLAL